MVDRFAGAARVRAIDEGDGDSVFGAGGNLLVPGSRGDEGIAGAKSSWGGEGGGSVRSGDAAVRTAAKARAAACNWAVHSQSRNDGHGADFAVCDVHLSAAVRSEEHTSELQSL